MTIPQFTKYRVASEAVFTRIAILVVNLVYLGLLAATLGAQQYGLLSLSISLAIVFLTFSFVGKNWLLSVEIGRNPNDEQTLLARYFPVRIITAFAAAVLCAAYGVTTAISGTGAILIAIYALSIIPRSLASLYFAALYGRGQANVVLRYELIGRICETSIILLVLRMWEWPIYWVPLVTLIVWIAQMRWLMRIIPKGKSVLPGFSEIRTVLMKGAPFAAIGGLLIWLYQLALLISPAELQTTSELGWIAISINISTVSVGLLLSAFAVLNRDIAQSAQMGRSLDTLVLSFGIAGAVLASAGAGLLLSLFAEPVFGGILGPTFAGIGDIAPAVGWFVASQIAVATAAYIIGFFERLWSAAIAIFAGIALTYLAISLLAPTGASRVLELVGAISWLTAFAITLVYCTCKGQFSRHAVYIWTGPVITMCVMLSFPSALAGAAFGGAAILIWIGFLALQIYRFTASGV